MKREKNKLLWMFGYEQRQMSEVQMTREEGKGGIEMSLSECVLTVF